MSQLNRVHTLVLYYLNLHFNIILPFTQYGFFFLRLYAKIIYEFLMYPMHASYPDYFILRDFTALVIFGEEYKL
jgi:hypothetical protein